MSKGAPRPPRPSTVQRLARIDDGTIIRLAFMGMLFGTAGVLYIDYRELMAGTQPTFALPSFGPSDPSETGPRLTTDPVAREAPLAMSLEPGGVLALTGTVDVGAAQRFSDELMVRGEYVRTIALDSPGGSVSDALAIGALIREKGFSTSVAPGALCASSCPLIFAGGTERFASRDSAVGVHQIYAAQASLPLSTTIRDSSLAMADAQRTTALISRHLAAMGVDAALWLHALETPPEDLYFLSPEEMTSFQLATTIH